MIIQVNGKKVAECDDIIRTVTVPGKLINIITKEPKPWVEVITKDPEVAEILERNGFEPRLCHTSDCLDQEF